MWVKRIPLHFVVDCSIQKNIISAEFINILDILTTQCPQPYNIGWLSQGRGIPITQQCHLPYGINPFKGNVLCDVAPLICGSIMLYMIHDLVVSLSLWEENIYQIPKIVAPTTIS